MAVYDLEGAREAGLDDSHIIKYLSDRIGYDLPAALEAGATDEQLLGYLMPRFNEVTHEDLTGFMPHAKSALEDIIPKVEEGVSTGAELLGMQKTAEEMKAKAEEAKRNKKHFAEETTQEEVNKANAENGLLGATPKWLSRNVTEPLGGMAGFAPAMAALPVAGTMGAIGTAGGLGLAATQALANTGEARERNPELSPERALLTGAGTAALDVAGVPGTGLLGKGVARLVEKATGRVTAKAAEEMIAKEATLAREAETAKRTADGTINTAEGQAAIHQAEQDAARAALDKLPDERTKLNLLRDFAAGTASNAVTVPTFMAGREAAMRLGTGEEQQSLGDIAQGFKENLPLAPVFGALHAVGHNPEKVAREQAEQRVSDIGATPEATAARENLAQEQAAKQAETERTTPFHESKIADPAAVWEDMRVHTDRADEDSPSWENLPDEAKVKFSSQIDELNKISTPDKKNPEVLVPTKKVIKAFDEVAGPSQKPLQAEKEAWHSTFGEDAHPYENIPEESKAQWRSLTAKEEHTFPHLTTGEPVPTKQAEALYKKATKPEHEYGQLKSELVPAAKAYDAFAKKQRPEEEGRLPTFNELGVESRKAVYDQYSNAKTGAQTITQADMGPILEAHKQDRPEWNPEGINEPIPYAEYETKPKAQKAEKVEPVEQEETVTQEPVAQEETIPEDNNHVYEDTTPSENDTGHTVESLKEHMTPEMRKMVDSGKAVLHDTHETLPSDVISPETVKGLVTPEGVAHFVASKLTPENLHGVFLHEVGVHAGMAKMLGPKVWENVKSQVLTQAGKPFEEARKAVPSDTPDHLKAEEIVAHLVERSPNLPIVKRITSAIRNFARQHLGANLKVTEHDLRHLAEKAVRHQVKLAKAEPKVENRYSRVDEKERLAPNGKPSKLNKMQYDQVRTPAFKEWFGDWENDPANASKVVDENGEPLVVYHGTSSQYKSYFINENGDFVDNTNGVYIDNHDFNEFNNDRLNASSDKGKGGFYFAGDYVYTPEENENLATTPYKATDIASGYSIAPSEIVDIPAYYKIEAEIKEKIGDDADSPFLMPEHLKSTYHQLKRKQGELTGAARGSNVIPAYISLKNPKIVDFFNRHKITESRIDVREKNYRNNAALVNSTIKEAQKEGYDGVIFNGINDEYSQMEGGKYGRVVIAFNPNQIKSAIGNTGAFSKTNNDIRYSRIPDEAKALSETGNTMQRPEKEEKENKTWENKFDDFMNTWVNGSHKLTKFLDENLPGYHHSGKLRADMLQAQKLQGHNIANAIIDTGSFKVNKDGTISAVEVPLKMVSTGRTRNVSLKSMVEMADSVGDWGRKAVQDMMYVYDKESVSKRDPKKLPEKYRKDPSILHKEVAQADALCAKYPALRDAMNSWTAINHSIVDEMYKSGLISPQQHREWKTNDFYIPNFMINEEIFEHTGVEKKGGIKIGNTMTKVFRERTGSEHTINAWENMKNHLASCATAVMDNEAKKAAVEQISILGAGHKVDASKKFERGNVAVMEHGKRVFYKLDDPSLIPAYTIIHNELGSLYKIPRSFARLTSMFLTNTPGFFKAELIRNPLQASLTNDLGWVSPVDTMKFISTPMTGRKKEITDKLIRNGIVGVVHDPNYASTHSGFVKNIGKGLTEENKLKKVNAKAENASAYMHSMIDAATKVNVYEMAFKKAKQELKMSDAEADSFAIAKARESFLPAMRGASETFQQLKYTIPFLASQIFGLEQMRRAVMGVGVPKSQRKAFKKKVAIKATQAAFIAGALSFYFLDNEDYQKQSDYNSLSIPTGDKDFVNIPLPKELSFLKWMPEMVMQASFETRTGDQLLKAASDLGKGMLPAGVGETYVPVPAVFKEPLQQAMNMDFHTNRGIETPAEQNVPVKNRGEKRSSYLGNVIAKNAPDFMHLSPVKVDHIFSSIGGTMAGVGLWGIDEFAQELNPDIVEKPAKDITSSSYLFGNMFPNKNKSVYLNDFYNENKRASEIHAQAEKYKQEGNTSEYHELMDDEKNKALYRASTELNRIKKQITEKNKIINSIKTAPNSKYTAQQRADRIEVIKAEINNLAKKGDLYYRKATGQ